MKVNVGVICALVATTVAATLTAPVSAAEAKSATVCAVVYNDKDHNGTQGAGEAILAGWHVVVNDEASGKTVATMTSAGEQKTCTTTPGAGRYAVSRAAKAGWAPTTPRLGTQTITVAAGGTTVLAFGATFSPTLAPVCVVAYADRNDNGRQDKGEPAVAGRRLTVKDDDTGQTVSTLKSGTDTTCARVLPGQYTVSEVADPAAVLTIPTASSQKATTAVGVTQVLKFGEHRFGLDHFECYALADARAQTRVVALTDQFGSRRATVNARQQLCTPVSKNDEKIKVPSGSLVCYAVSAGASPGKTVMTSDQFGEATLEVGAPRRLCLPSGTSLTGNPPGPPARLDHYLCYDAKPVDAKRYPRVSLADQLWSTSAQVVTPTGLCTPVRKDVGSAKGSVVNSSDHLVCYTIKTDAFRPRPISAKNQFETPALRVISPQTLCVPAVKRVEDAPEQLDGCDTGDSEAPAGSVAADGPVDENNGPVQNLYPSQDTTTDNWYDDDLGCDWSIGGTVPPDALDTGVDKAVAGLGDAATKDLVNDLGKVEGQALHMAEGRPQVPTDLPAVTYCEQTAASKACQYTAPPNPPALHANQPFGGRDIIFVHGFQVAPIAAKINSSGSPASTKWPGNPGQFIGAGGYWKMNADAYWGSHITKYLGSTTSPSNRYLTVAWPSTQWLVYGAHALLTETARAMNDGTGVVPTSNGDKSGFCARGCVIVSHSTGGPLVDVAMSIAKHTTLFGDLRFIPDHMRAHVAFSGAFSGSGFATPALYLGLATVGSAPLCQLGAAVVNALGASVGGCGSLTAIVESVLLDLVPPVMNGLWGPVIDKTPVQTLTIASEHPSSYGSTTSYSYPLVFLKWLLSRGFDDGVLPMNSTCATYSNPPTLPEALFPDNIGWPSGYVAKPTVLDAAINTQLGVLAPHTYPETPVVARVFDMYNAGRGVGFYLDQVGDRYLAYFLNPGSPVNWVPYYVAAGCTPYVAPNGMVQPVALTATHALWHQEEDTNPLNRYGNHYSFLQSTGDHFGYEEAGHCYEGYFTANHACTGNEKIDNAEEVRAVMDDTVYVHPCAQAGPECAPLLSGLVKTSVGEEVHGQPLCKKWKWCRRIWIWKRVYHRMIGWRTNTEADYAYRYILRF
jgi:hypothetical protein